MFKTSGPLKVVLLLYAVCVCQEYEEFKNAPVSCFILFNFQKQLSVIDLLSELKIFGSRSL